jgi:hypothetical protein
MSRVWGTPSLIRPVESSTPIPVSTSTGNSRGGRGRGAHVPRGGRGGGTSDTKTRATNGIVKTSTSVVTKPDESKVAVERKAPPAKKAPVTIDILIDSVLCHIISFCSQATICLRLIFLSKRFHRVSRSPLSWHHLDVSGLPPYGLAQWLSTLPRRLGLTRLSAQWGINCCPAHFQMLTPHICRTLTRLAVSTAHSFTVEDVTSWLDSFATYPLEAPSLVQSLSAGWAASSSVKSEDNVSRFVLQHLRIDTIYAAGWDTLLSRHGHALQHFRLTVNPTAPLWSAVTIVRLLSQHCPNLTRLRIRVTVENDSPASTLVPDDFGPLLSSLRRLQFHGIWEDLSTLATLVKSFKELHEFRFPTRGRDGMDHGTVLEALIETHRQHIDAITELDIDPDAGDDPYRPLKEVNLKKLSIGGYGYVPFHFFKHMTNLEILVCSNIYSILSLRVGSCFVTIIMWCDDSMVVFVWKMVITY